MLEDVLKSRPYTRLFVQSEVLQKKPIDEAFESFCNILGDNAMEYQEFDYWYYHFVNGNFDLDYERKTEPKSLELADMPIDVAYKIVEKLNWKEKCIFRNVSQKCRQIVDAKPIIIESIYVNDCDDHEICLSFDYMKYTLKYGVNKLKQIVLMENGKEVIICQKEKEKIDFEIDGREEYEKRAVETLSIILSNPKIIILDLAFRIKGKSLMDKLHALFKTLNHQLHVENFEIEVDRNFQWIYPEEINLMKFLPHFKPGILGNITLFDYKPGDQGLASNFGNPTELEQWKQAKQFYTTYNISDYLDKVTHFDQLCACLNDNIDPEHMIYFKNAFLNSPTFEECELHSNNMDEERINEELGGEEFPTPDGRTLYVNASQGTIYFRKEQN